MNSDGPYVAVATLCDAVLKEEDGRISCIRFMDRIDVNMTFPASVPEAQQIPAIPFPVHGLLSFKSGGFKGKKTIKINLVAPSGKLVESEGKISQTFPAVFQGGEHGFNLVLDVTLQTREEGLYYFDILLDEEMMTRIPLRVAFTKQTQSDAAAQPESLTKADTSGAEAQK